MLFNLIRTIADSLSTVTNHTAIDTIYVSSNNTTTVPLIITAIAVLISAVSVYISYRALTANLKHQKLSVRPLLTSLEEFSLSNPDGIGIILKSSGLGPAIVKEFKMKWNDTEINKKNYHIITGALGIKKIAFYNYEKNAIIEKDASFWILRIPYESITDDEDYKSIVAEGILDKVSKEFSFSIIYTSIYYDEDDELITRYHYKNS
jgi:hypothetical protein